MDADRLNEAEDLVERSELRDENRKLRAENERLRAALRMACDDGWPDGEQAMKDYLRGAAQEQSDGAIPAQPKEKP